MATFHILPNGEKAMYLKGSVEKIFAKCVNQFDENGSVSAINRDLINQQVEAMAAKGLRVLAFARGGYLGKERSHGARRYS